jgi:DNA-binding transcriptional regulator YdaS (Cro superfamily)
METNTAITRQLMRPARTLETDWKHVLRASVSTGAKEYESSAGRFWAAGFHHITARSRVAGVLKLANFFSFSLPRILNQWIRGHNCIFIF